LLEPAHYYKMFRGIGMPILPTTSCTTFEMPKYSLSFVFFKVDILETKKDWATFSTWWWNLSSAHNYIRDDDVFFCPQTRSS